MLYRCRNNSMFVWGKLRKRATCICQAVHVCFSMLTLHIHHNNFKQRKTNHWFQKFQTKNKFKQLVIITKSTCVCITDLFFRRSYFWESIFSNQLFVDLHFPSPANTVRTLLPLFHSFHKTRTLAPGTAYLKQDNKTVQRIENFRLYFLSIDMQMTLRK